MTNTIKQLTDNILKTDRDKNNSYIDFEALAEDLKLDYSITDNINYELNDSLRSYFIASHICTDTEVGIKAYFFKDELVCISTQNGRKSDEFISGWVSKEKAVEVREYIKLLAFQDESFEVDILDLTEDLGEGYKIEYTGQNLAKHVIYKGDLCEVIEDKSNGYKNFHNIVIKKDKENITVDIRDCLAPFRTKKNTECFRS